MGGSSSNDVGGSENNSSSTTSSSTNDKDTQSKAESFDRSMSNAERPDRAPAETSTSSSSTGSNGGSRSPNDDGGGHSLSNDNRPDRAPPETSTTSSSSEPDDRSRSPNDDSGGPSLSNAERPDRAPAATTTNEPASTAPDQGPQSPNENDRPEQEERGFFDRAGDFFSNVGRGMQDFARSNPRVDSYGNPVGLVDSDGIQRGEVASRVMSSGTSPEDLADQLGFTSPGDMAASQTTDFIDDKLQKDLETRAMEQALNERYGRHPDLDRLIANGDLTFRNAQQPAVEEPQLLGGAANDQLGPSPYDTSIAFGDIEYTINNRNILSTAEQRLREGDIDGYYSEINKFDPYGNMALDVRQQFGPSGVIAADFYRDSLEKEGFTPQQIDELWSKDTEALAWADLAARKAEVENYSSGSPVQGYDGVLSEDRIAQYHEDAMMDRYDNWTGKVPYEELGRWMAMTPQDRVDLANDMVDLARSGNTAARAWVEEAISDWNTIGTMAANPGEILSTFPDSMRLVGPSLGIIDEATYDDRNLSP